MLNPLSDEKMKVPAIIIAGIVIILSAASFFVMTIQEALFFTALLVVLGWISYTDIKEHKIKNAAVLALLVLSLISTALWNIPISERLIAAALVLVSFLVLLAIIKNGVGMGDIKMLTALALMLGYSIIYVIFLGSIAQAVYILVVKLCFKKNTKDLRVPAGPFYAAAVVVILLIKSGLVLSG